MPDFCIAMPTLVLSVYAAVTSCQRIVHRRVWVLLPMLLHLVSIVGICLTTANVQIVTRMVVSNCPLFLWSVASLLCKREWTKKVMLFYWVGYFVVGTGVFSLFLPGT